MVVCIYDFKKLVFTTFFINMKLFTDAGNFNTLKLIAVGEENGISLEKVEKKHGGMYL